MFLKFDEGKTATIECNDVKWCDSAMKGLIGNYDDTIISIDNGHSSNIDEINKRVRELEEKLESLFKEEKEQGIRAQLETLHFNS